MQGDAKEMAAKTLSRRQTRRFLPSVKGRVAVNPVQKMQDAARRCPIIKGAKRLAVKVKPAGITTTGKRSNWSTETDPPRKRLKPGQTCTTTAGDAANHDEATFVSAKTVPLAQGQDVTKLSLDPEHTSIVVKQKLRVTTKLTASIASAPSNQFFHPVIYQSLSGGPQISDFGPPRKQRSDQSSIIPPSVSPCLKRELETFSTKAEQMQTAPKGLFQDVVCYINGYTGTGEMSAFELKRLILLHGGHILSGFVKKQVTHLICTNLCASKAKAALVRAVGRKRKIFFVRPEWVMESIAKNALQSEAQYAVLRDSDEAELITSYLERRKSSVSNASESSDDTEYCFPAES